MSKASAEVEELPPPPPETLGQKATYWQYRAVWEAASRLPEPLYWAAPERLGAAAYRLAPDGQKDQIRRNLRRVLGGDPDPEHLEQVVADSYVSYVRYWLDSFRLHRLTEDYVLERSTGEGLEIVDALRDSGKGGIMATLHLGSWDVGAFFTSARDWRLAVVAEVLEPRRLFDRFVQLRRDIGLEVYPLVRGGDMVERMEDVIRRGGIATLLSDRDLTKKGPIVEFFGEPCRLPPGPAVLARRTKRPVAIAAFVTTPRGWHGVISNQIDISHLSVEDGTQAVARELEVLIRCYPDQWHVWVRNWLADREPDHPLVRT